MGGQFNNEFEQVKRSCVDLTSQMRCPHHFKNATVEMAGERFDDFSMDIITCCDEFRKRIEEALDNLVAQQSLIVSPLATITMPNASIKYPPASSGGGSLVPLHPPSPALAYIEIGPQQQVDSPERRP